MSCMAAPSVLPADSAMRIGFYMSLLMIVLRLVTNAPIFAKKE